MLKVCQNNINDLFRGTSRVKEIYLGEIKVYPGLINTVSGTQYSGWFYYLPNRSRTATAYTEYVYQNGTTSRTFGQQSQQIETAVISYVDPGVWIYFQNNSFRKKFVTPVYTFTSDNTVFHGEDIETIEYGIDVSQWQYNQHVRTKQIIYQYSDIQKPGPTLYEEAVITYENGNWMYDQLPNLRYRNSTPIYTFSKYYPEAIKDGNMFQESDNVTTYSTEWQYDYANSKRIGITIYQFASGGSHQVSGVVQQPTAIETIDSGDYDGGVCDYQTFEYVDYLQIRKIFYWPSSPSPTTYDWHNGPERRQKIDGMCGWVRSWTQWANNGQYCGETGALGYSCDGEYSVVYYRQARYFQYPDGSGRTLTEFRAGSEYSRELVHGQCGYVSPYARAEVLYYGFDANSPLDAYKSGSSGSIWYDGTDGYYYDSINGFDKIQNGYYLIEDTGEWSNSDYLYINY